MCIDQIFQESDMAWSGYNKQWLFCDCRILYESCF